MKKIEKKHFFIFGMIAVLLLIIIFWLIIGKKLKSKNDDRQQLIPTETIIPTIDSSVKVSLTPFSQGKEVLLSIKSIPLGTKSLEYILSYETEDGGLQGVNSLAEVQGREFEKKITLGTCSSGTCVYHQIKGEIKLELKFIGDYGEKIFEKNYSL
ncbi:MAG: hypothetical protein N2482_00285 [Patescibacteria group bacterium]|nr:hypothetical protein [Patescibacteria group bacterium]